LQNMEEIIEEEIKDAKAKKEWGMDSIIRSFL
jgi:predicted TIM-barrel enzyme